MNTFARGMPRRPILWLLPALAASSFAAASAERPAMHWMVLNLPPYNIPAQHGPGQGILDGIVQLVVRDMDNHQHSYETTNIPRAFRSLDAGEPACYASAVWTPERERRYFATWTLVTPAIRIIVRESVYQKLPLNASGEVLLDELLRTRTLRGVVVKQRSYSAPIDGLLEKYRDTGSTTRVSTGDSGLNVLRLLAGGRADYSFEHDLLIDYEAGKHPLPRGLEALRAVPIAGIGPVHAAVLCPRTPWGRERIIAIDAALARLAQGREYRAAVEHWYTPEAQQRMRSLQDEFFKARARPSPPERYQLP